jgi:hypothetical protein
MANPFRFVRIECKHATVLASAPLSFVDDIATIELTVAGDQFHAGI